jgi:cellobiose-specific phosphotransferase system component IIB
MDQEAKVMIVVAACVTAALIVKTIASAIVRLAEASRHRNVEVDATSIRERLERIEIAVDTIAIEVERLGEHQRFNAQLAMNRPEPLPKNVVTPH